MRKVLVMVAAGALLLMAAPAQAAVPTCFGREATIVGTLGDDMLTGTDGRDVIVGRAGTDRVLAGDGNDFVCGNSGGDRIDGQGGSDRIDGARGFDYVWGEQCSDLVPCVEGDDVILNGEEVYAGGGDDYLREHGPIVEWYGEDGFDTCIVTSTRDHVHCEVVKVRG
jgi:Ca2+-binding RTX toxin-like protein